MSGTMLKIEKFTEGYSFSLWKIKMESLLKSQGIWAPLIRDKGAMDVASSEYKLMEEKAHSNIILCISDDVIMEVAGEKTAVNDEDVALLILISLPSSYENFVQHFIVNKDSISLEEVRSALHAREIRQKGTSTEYHASGLMANKGSKNKKNKKKQFSGSILPKDVCAWCKEKGHGKRDCPKQGQQGQNGSAAMVEKGSSSEDDYVLSMNDVTHQSDVWVLDCRASYHICSNK
ncbi:hypothetical protein AXG93_4876s1190 [Marchantia polymorpha subsp. ruderalis]|uniref:CCHC-type domain-containing protein n=1 Tax=Marchantia polymorpha subsp. ruderalis TaxID=1480154 RepID=A0A176WC46_MARPO|nr:hypothetical protein AXG93_4876s1190 [Marchantia polymorpha subsp. ruderalis]